MRIKRKVINILELTPTEVDQFAQMLSEASEGHTVHYSERQTGPNQFFGVSVDQRHEPIVASRDRNGDREKILTK